MVLTVTTVAMNITGVSSETPGHDNETELLVGIQVKSLETENVPYVFDRFSVRLALCLLYALVFIFCVLGIH